MSFDPAPDFSDIACSMASLALAMEIRDAYTRGHCDRTGRIARALGQCFDLDAEQLEQLELAAHFHDVGKIGVPDRVLFHTGPVADEDWPAIQAHSELGERIFLASGHRYATEVATLIRHHHEAIDGSGYPDGLAGAAIPLGARILRVADSYDAMTTRRPYAEGRAHGMAMRILHAEQEGKIDADVFRVFERLMGDAAMREA
ncbi:HD-GYP domain-containing protein (c-di-GMP phosphodiesterase class II) [Pseudoxanthomonas japonensis]|jgi:HD-GYP domain-containing protein (c-di-GMP phosphodiesterase class II)|uniref:HD-GYP domain-containing protein n=1 Tax=Pseudoxanthomonas TaxID=83618 RepID=UPI00078363E2|nr:MULTISPECIES: HD domain-containing phosphohydrolase [Pseudoxanthomonas]MBA3929342.1 HD domain-containing protein [Xanthomonas sp.]MBL8257130.1 HD domain-containing protein [Pseudoxanthomonas mexicana]MDR7069049.1 HD-GYP domain-containing protein (c-di-GMP phosphodiesterase class II) [Pseudoxanthomonas japonensis]